MKIKSFTLVEILLYTALASVVIFTISTLLSSILQAREKAKAIYEVEFQGENLISQVTQSLRNARDVNSPSIGTSADILNLAVDSSEKNPTVFSLNNQAVSIKEGAGAEIALTSPQVAITSLSFQNISQGATYPDDVKIQFTLKFNSQDNRYEHTYEKTFTSSVNLRNTP